MLHNRGGS